MNEKEAESFLIGALSGKYDHDKEDALNILEGLPANKPSRTAGESYLRKLHAAINLLVTKERVHDTV